ncbi:MAG: SAM-dependent methyltransferase, partial [Gemmataceae bacterium]|nr:SAM-dependent methyltransferase [Gemmataceae bacterium]
PHDAPVVESHNRVKDVPLPEGEADHLLEVMGISGPDGRVRPTMRAKFNQINEFLKQIAHTLDDAKLNNLGREIRILDCGCGSSYLTLAAHHYLNDVLQIPTQILGVDVNDEVIRASVERADRLGANGLFFECRKIGTADVDADIVLALHACDTATDDAIAQAVRSEARLLLSVPCCHHDLNKVLTAGGPSEVLRPMLRHGILLQRTADLVTDAFRALALRIMGYRTDVVEFVGTEHTPRNLMIRAVRGPAPGDAAHVAEYVELKRFWRVTPYIEKVLGEPFQNLVKAGAS